MSFSDIDFPHLFLRDNFNLIFRLLLHSFFAATPDEWCLLLLNLVTPDAGDNLNNL